jgi:hypothetical protein
VTQDNPKARRQRRVVGGAKNRINVRITESTYERLVALAASARLSLPRFLVESALRSSSGGWSLREQRWWAERLHVVETRLIRIGTNVNQIAAATNATGVPAEGLSATLAYVTATLARLHEVLDAIESADRSRDPERSP